jgi:hypothetical protein
MIDAEGFTNPLARAEPTSSVPVLGRHYNQNCTEYGYCALFPARGGLGRERGGVKRRKVRGKQTNTQFGRQCLTEVFGWMCSVPRFPLLQLALY